MISRDAHGKPLCKDTTFGGNNLEITTSEVDTRDSLELLEFETRLLCRLVSIRSAFASLVCKWD